MQNLVSIIIPTCGRPTKIGRTLVALSRQCLPLGIEIEVIVAIDGGWGPDDLRPTVALPDTRFLELPRVGVSAARNAALREARGELVIFSNDDTYPDANWVAEHVAGQRARGTPGMVIGETRWVPWPDMTVFDGLLRDTSMIFFYDQMTPGESYGFRHFWTCNASAPREMIMDAGGFEERLRPVFFEDCELAFRIEKSVGSRVHYHAAAKNVHDHRLTWSDYCRREQCLGRVAAILAEVNPACFEAIYGTADADGLAENYESWLSQGREEHEAAERRMAEWGTRSLAEVGDWEALREELYQLHLPMKRRLFREAFVRARREMIRGPADGRSSQVYISR